MQTPIRDTYQDTNHVTKEADHSVCARHLVHTENTMSKIMEIKCHVFDKNYYF